MTKRTPVSAQQNIWFDAQQVDDTDLKLEQQYNTTIESSTVNNHIGNGVIPESLLQPVLFDSSTLSAFLDGTIVQAQNQPSDTNYGNQLEVELTDSKACGKRTVKVCIIGLDFESNLQYETFIFNVNEIQVGIKHFTNILLILFNDFIGDPSSSLNLGGTIVIRQANPAELSRDPIMVAQDIQPNLFFRDFVTSGYATLQQLLLAALPYYDIDSLNIYTSAVDQKVLLVNDITTHIGQKFIAKTNNIQKITLLLSVRNQEVGSEDDLAWTGDLVLSVYPLQSTVECPTDIVPNLDIDYPPTNIPLAQLSIDYNDLIDAGIVLSSVPQPVDFVFSNSSIAGGNLITTGNYYAFTLKRAGSANKCDILIDSGGDRIDDSRITTFTGTVWVDIPEEDLWFKIYTDAAKVADAQSYDAGHGIIIEKTTIDSDTQSTIDYCYRNISFSGNTVYKAVLSAITEEGTPIPDARTGQPVNSRQQYIPQVELLNSIDVANLEAASEPVLIGSIADRNKKSYDASDATITSALHSATIVGEEILIRVVSDTTDVVRYDTSVIALESNLLEGDLVDAKITPDASVPEIYYRVSEAKLCSMLMGDVNGDGIIDADDLTLLNSYIGYNLNTGLPLLTTITTDGVHTTYTNGYNTYIAAFTSAFSLSFQVVDPITNDVITSGSDGVLVADPSDERLAQFTSSSVSFSSITGLSGYKLVISTSTLEVNHGGFDITSIDTLTDVITIRKVVLSGDVIGQMLRADIDEDFVITDNDGYLLESYINRVSYIDGYHTYPAPSTNPYTKIGTRFNVIKLKVQKFIDRADDYYSTMISRPVEIHPEQDVFVDGYTSFESHNFYTNPISLSIYKELTWDEYLVVSNSRAKKVPCVFTNQSGYTSHLCALDGVICSSYEDKSTFDSGRVDLFVPNNIIIDTGGEIHRPDGNFYKVDFEVGTIVLEIPNGLYGDERTIDIVLDFVASAIDGSGSLTGLTRLGFPAMRFADCSYVTSSALSLDQLRFSVAVQSFSPNTNGISDDGYEGAIVDGKMGVSMDYSTGLLTLNFTNLFQDEVLRTLSTKVQINVYLKQGGFNNEPLFVDSTKVQNMLELISVFSGTIDGGPSALVDLDVDTTGILPIIHGGTGLNSTGTTGTVLTSSGSSLSYQFIYDLPGVIAYSTGIPDAGKIPKLDGYGILDPSFYYKNPVYIYGVAGLYSDGYLTTIGGLTFRFDSFILQGLDSIKLEVILETSNSGYPAGVKLYDITAAGYVDIGGPGVTELQTRNTFPTLIRSEDLTALLQVGATDHIYEIHINLTPNDWIEYTTCKMARFVITYDNPTNVTPPLANSYNFVPFPPP